MDTSLATWRSFLDPELITTGRWSMLGNCTNTDKLLRREELWVSFVGVCLFALAFDCTLSTEVR